MEKVRIQDDLFTYVNQETIDKLVIPDDKPTAGGFQVLADDVEKLMIGEFNQMSKSKEYPNEYLANACKLYQLVKNVKKREKDGITPALKNVQILDKVVDMKSFTRAYKNLKLRKIPVPFSISVDTDMKDSKKHCVMVQGPSVILPDASYYKPEMAQQKEMILGIWTNVAKAIIAKTDLSPEDQELYIADTLKFDALLGDLVKTSEEWSEYIKAYNPMKVSKVASFVKPVNFRSILKSLFGFIPETIIVTEPRYFKAFKEVFNEENFVAYKHWAYVNAIINSCSYLTEELRDLGGAYMRAISGIKACTPLEKFAYHLASGTYSEPVGLYYGEKYFGEEAKKDITEIVYQIIDTYKSRILSNEILEESTKQKAILKLSKMGVKMGYPDKVRDIYSKLVFSPRKSLFDVMLTISQIRTLDSLEKLTKPTDPTEWPMPGHMVNACYNPSVNDITFPAAILQPPFYSLKQSRSENLGGIGAVIGHEISHAFDSNGAKCDENGNINNWWTKTDERKFKTKVNAMVKQFDGIELPWGKVNGKFIVSENMADNGGMAVTLEIMGKTPNASYEEYFTNWAKVWCMKAKPEYQQLLLNLDVHGPAILRTNMPPRNFPEWYETFKVKKTDKMYLAPNKRVVIW
ncbi:MAG: M13 family peptidase [Clostridia bacterium]|nr:M13 family peptidase [Clostridia bacterium]